ncbi:hypothetical protein M8J76_004615 [Diaphorina citri]|nr:hypothetical protein M8J76_004615 [Diaphorina citri]
MESDLILIARAIDEKIKYIESKLEKPYLIGFNHNNEPAQEAEKIVNNLMKEMDEMVEEQEEISKLLEDEIKELEASNQDYKKFLTDGQSQLDECETYACNNLPGYKKYVPPEVCPRDVLTDPSELPDIFTSPAPPNDQEDPDPVLTTEDPIEDIPTQNSNLNDHTDGELNDNNLNTNSMNEEDDLFQDDSHLDLVSSPLLDPDNVKPVVAKKLNFDQPPSEVEHKKKTTKPRSEDIENLSGIQNIGGSTQKQIPPSKLPARNILTERSQFPPNQADPQEGPWGGVKTNASSKEIPSLGKKNTGRNDLPPANFKREFKDPTRRDTLGGRKDPLLPEGIRRDTLGGKSVLPGGFRRDTLSGRRDLPAGLRDGFARDTLGGIRDTLGGRKDGLPSGLRDGFARDTLSGIRDTLGGRKDGLPSGLRDGFSRDTLGSRRDTLGGRRDGLPSGLRDGLQRDTLTGEVISSRRLSHYRAVPKMRFGTLPSPPKEPVTSELGLKMIGRLK